MRQVSLLLVFLLCLTAVLFLPIFWPAARLTFFAPYLIFSYYQRPFQRSMWISFGCGIIMDLLTPLPRFGLYSLNYCLTTLLLYSKKRHFFEDSLTTLPFMAFFFSFISTLIQVCLLTVFAEGISLSWGWMLTDIAFYPLIDAVYAFVCFTVPFIMFRSVRRKVAA